MIRLLLMMMAAAPAHAFCGFFVAGSNAKLANQASQVVLVRNGHRTAMTLSNDYHGPPESFAMVVPVPVVLHKEDVKTLPPNVFEHVESLSAPRLVEYWERDPCAPQIELELQGGLGGIGSGSGGGGSTHGVKIEAQFAVGEYEIVILSAKDSSGLESWLHENHYTIPNGAKEALAPYVREQMKFFVAKVDIQKVHKDENGVVVLSPLRFSFDSDELRLPVRLGLLNANGKQDLIVYILHPRSRFEVANYPNVFVPTNLEVADEVRKDFAAFYAELFDATLLHSNGKAVVTEYSWDTSSCDPCPAPPLSPSEVLTLGGEGARWVLTRLHTRYDKATLSEDLIFREARPMMGGRANWSGTSSDDGARPAGINNFQGRYIIRHYWTGAAKCDHPRYDTWGGPPDASQPKPAAARGLASVSRGKVDLKSAVRSPVPALGIPGQPRRKR